MFSVARSLGSSLERTRVRADGGFERSRKSRVGSGLQFVPPSFLLAEGVFDLLVFFHGNGELVAESAAAKLNGLVHVVNVGLGSGA